MNALKQILKALTPHGLVEMRRRRIFREPHDESAERVRFHEKRREEILAAHASAASRRVIDAENRRDVFDFLTARGIPPHHVREGSVPEASLAFLREHVQGLPDSRPLLGLHVGNFVGVSLAFLVAGLKKRHPGSLVIAIDPNLPHRGVNNPQEHVAALLSACGLQQSVLLVAGYSGAKSVSNDGVVFAGYDPAAQFANEAACENTLENLARLLPQQCDIALMDGNHEGPYLAAELARTIPLMRPGGLVVLDDVDSAWEEIRAVFEQAKAFGLEPIGADGRIGVARVL